MQSGEPSTFQAVGEREMAPDDIFGVGQTVALRQVVGPSDLGIAIDRDFIWACQQGAKLA
jgi:hypothetical protein